MSDPVKGKVYLKKWSSSYL